MTDEELIAALRAVVPTVYDAHDAADRIEALVKERDQWIEHTKNAVWADSEELKLANARAERLEAALTLTIRADELRELYHALPNDGHRIGQKRSPKGHARDAWLRAFRKAANASRAALKGADHV